MARPARTRYPRDRAATQLDSRPLAQPGWPPAGRLRRAPRRS